MIRKFFGTVLFGSAVLFAKTADFVAYWNLGDQKDYTVHYSRDFAKKGHVFQTRKASYQVHLNVLDSAEKSYTLEWGTSNADFKMDDLTNQMMDAIAKIGPEVKTLYTTDEMGALQGIKNEAELKQYYAKAIDAMFAQFPDTLAGAAQKFKEMMLGDQMFQNIYLRDLNLFHGAMGAAYEKGPHPSTQVEWPNPFGAGNLPAKMSYVVKKTPAQADYMDLETHTQLDPKSGKLLLDAMSKQLQLDLGEVKKMGVKIEEITQYRLRKSTGWPISVRYEKKVQMQDNTQSEILEIQEIKP